MALGIGISRFYLVVNKVPNSRIKAAIEAETQKRSLSVHEYIPLLDDVTESCIVGLPVQPDSLAAQTSSQPFFRFLSTTSV